MIVLKAPKSKREAATVITVNTNSTLNTLKYVLSGMM
jgi:hypothetical protein